MTDYKEYEDVATEDYIVVKALSEGVQVIGLTRGGETRSHHTEMLDAGEVYDKNVCNQNKGRRRNTDETRRCPKQ